jgi:hypothetical protein
MLDSVGPKPAKAANGRRSTPMENEVPLTGVHLRSSAAKNL